MNAQLPPNDPMLRGQLARRSSGPAPKGLLAETYARLDAAPQRARMSAPRALHLPRLAWAAAGLVAAALLAVAVALPALHPGPTGQTAGYPAERALTTAELAELMAGPELAQNTALVAAVTIQARSDVCPMNRWPTVGVIEGMKSQVCVMGSDLSARLPTDNTSGTFAFRYIAPGYLGLVAAITPSSSRLAFHVAEDWPIDGTAFLVQGYLGATDVPCATETASAGDILNPSGYEQCAWSWLSDDGSPAAVQSFPTWTPPASSPQPVANRSIDLLVLDGKARHVEAGGARQIDSIPYGTTHGVYVVGWATGPCPGAAPYDSYACATWRVLAKVPELSLPNRETPGPSKTASPSPRFPGYPAERALTTAELAQVMTGPALPSLTELVASVTIRSDPNACFSERLGLLGAGLGVIEGVDRQICVFGSSLWTANASPDVSGTYAFRYDAPGILSLDAEVTRGPGRQAFHVADDWPLAPNTVSAFVVEGYLGGTPLPCAYATYGADLLGSSGCMQSWLSDDGSAGALEPLPTNSAGSPVLDPSFDWLALRGKARYVSAEAAREINKIPATTTFGWYLVAGSTGPCLRGVAGSPDCTSWGVLAKLSDLSLPASAATPIATPPVSASSTTSAYWDPAVHPLTTAELPRALSVAQTGQLLVADVSIDGASNCAGFKGYKALGRIAGLADQVCVVGINDSDAIHRPAASSGVFAFRLLGAGVLGYLGTIDSAGSLGLAHSATEPWPADQTIVVYGWLAAGPQPVHCTAIGATDALDPASAGCTAVWLTGTQKTFAQASADAGTGGARLVFEGILPSDDSAVITAGQASAYLLRDERSDCSGTTDGSPQHWCGWEVMGHVAPITLPPVTAPPATPIATSTLPSGAAPLGLAGPGGRAATVAEFTNAWTTDPAHLAGRIVVTKGPIPTGFMCWDAGQADASASPGTCHIGVLEGTIAPEGYWVVKVGSEGKLSIMGELGSDAGPWSVNYLCGGHGRAGDLVVVQGRLQDAGCPVAIDAGAGDFSNGPNPGGPLWTFFLARLGNPSLVLGALEPLSTAG